MPDYGGHCSGVLEALQKFLAPLSYCLHLQFSAHKARSKSTAKLDDVSSCDRPSRCLRRRTLVAACCTPDQPSAAPLRRARACTCPRRTSLHTGDFYIFHAAARPAPCSLSRPPAACWDPVEACSPSQPTSGQSRPPCRGRRLAHACCLLHLPLEHCCRPPPPGYLRHFLPKPTTLPARRQTLPREFFAGPGAVCARRARPSVPVFIDHPRRGALVATTYPQSLPPAADPQTAIQLPLAQFGYPPGPGLSVNADRATEHLGRRPTVHCPVSTADCTGTGTTNARISVLRLH